MNPTLSPGIDIVQPSGAYLLRDEFSVDVAAGSVNGTAAVPGPGTRTVVDLAGNKVSIGSGNLIVQGGGSWSDTSLYYLAVSSWSAGLLMLAKIKNTGGENLVNPGYSGWDAGFLFSDWFRGWGPPMHIVPALPNVWYDTAISARTVGHFIFVKQSTSNNWILCRVRNESCLSSTFGATVQSVSGALTVSSLRVPVARWLPTPLVSDGFGSAFGSSDGLGHAEGVAGGIGAGGAGVTWSNAGNTWSVSAGKAINTPATFTPITVLNGGFDSNTANWEAAAGATLASIGGGQSGNCLEITNGVENFAYVLQSFGVPTGTWARAQVYAKNGTSGSHILVPDTGTIFTLSGSNADWTLKTLTFPFRANPQILRLGLYVNTVGKTTLYDTVSMDSMTLSELISVANLACADVLSGAAITRGSTATAGGLALNWDSSSSPANGVLIYLLGGNIYVDKYVAGVWSAVSTTAYTYSAGARLVVAKNGTEYRVYYNNALVVANTITDAGIITNTLHGLFSTDPSNTFDDYVAYATGSSGEYNALNAF